MRQGNVAWRRLLLVGFLRHPNLHGYDYRYNAVMSNENFSLTVLFACE